MVSSPPIDDSPDFVDERMKMYEEWVHVAKVRALRTLGHDN